MIKINSPVMAMAMRANPLYLPTPASSDMPVPLEINMAPICHQVSIWSQIHRRGNICIRDANCAELTSGAHDPLAILLTHSSRITTRVNQTAAMPMAITAMRGMGVLSIKPTRADPMRARMNRVKRSPRHVATGAVMLSKAEISAPASHLPLEL